MGIFLKFTIVPNRISQDDWEKTYMEALKLADKCDFLDHIFAERSGQKYAYARKTAERDLSGKGLGINICGTMTSGSHMEHFALFRDIKHYQKNSDTKDDGADILLSAAGLWQLDIPQPNMACELWGGKTQGEPAHIPLLAIACLFADRFPHAVTVGGDISAGQCRAAVRMVKELLDKDIQLPVVCQADILAKRLKSTNIPEQKQIESFFEIFLGTLNSVVGDYLKETFSTESLYQYFRDAFSNSKSHSFSTILSDYLLLGFDFSILMQMLVLDKKGPALSLKEALTKLFSYSIHIPYSEKNCEDPLLSNAVDGDEESPSTIGGLLGRAFFAMAAGRNRNLPIYVPLDTIREVCRPLSPSSDTLIDNILSEMEPDERQEKVYGQSENSIISMIQQRAEELQAEESDNALYDISSPPDLFYYHPGCTFNPKFEKNLMHALRQIQAFDIEEDFNNFVKLDREGREAWFLRQNRYVLFREEVWNHILDHVMEDEYIRQYYLIFRVDCSYKSSSDLIEPLMSNVKMFETLWNEALKSK